MSSLRKICLIGCIALLLASATTAVSFAQLREQPGLLKRIWPFGRQQQAVPLAPETADKGEKSGKSDEGEPPLIAPFLRNKIDINTCTLEQIQSLPGVNAAMGAHIFAGRPYRDLQDLQRDGVPLNVVQGLRSKITFGR